MCAKSKYFGLMCGFYKQYPNSASGLKAFEAAMTAFGYRFDRTPPRNILLWELDLLNVEVKQNWRGSWENARGEIRNCLERLRKQGYLCEK